MKNKYTWFFPMVSFIMFATFLWAYIAPRDTVQIRTLVSFGSGFLAYSMMLVLILISVRPKVIERKLGLPDMYHIHGYMGMVLTFAVLVHVVIQWNGLQSIADMSLLSRTGFLGVLFLAASVLSGTLVLSNTFIKRSRKLMGMKENYYKREKHLWAHRLSILAVVAIFWHIRTIASGSLEVLLWIYTGFTLGWYVIYTLQIFALPKYEVVSISMPSSTVYELEVRPKNGEMMNYEPGQYVFLRFVDSEMPRESHPFSISSAPNQSKGTLQIMIKTLGDFTSALHKVKPGDAVTLQGPFGNYFTEDLANNDNPLILMGGGIGVTPNLSVVRSEVAKNSKRKMHLIWGLAFKEDIMLVEELEAIKSANPNFSYHFIFSEEEVEGYPFGFVTENYLKDIGVDTLYDEGEFFICGPGPMMSAISNVLMKNGVDSENIHLEEFSF